MNILIIAIIFVTVMALFILWVVRDDKRMDAERDKRNDDINAILQRARIDLDLKFETTLRDRYSADQLSNHEYCIRKCIREILRARASDERLQNALGDWHAAPEGTEARLRKGISLYHQFRLSDRTRHYNQVKGEVQAIKDALQMHLEALYRQLHASAGEDLQSFIRLSTLISDSRRWFSAFNGEAIKPLMAPPNWPELVAQHLPNPTLSDYHGCEPVTDGQLRLKAAKALIGEGDIVQAKVVLAYCNADQCYRDEVGESRASELADLVVQLNTTQQDQPR